MLLSRLATRMSRVQMARRRMSSAGARRKIREGDASVAALRSTKNELQQAQQTITELEGELEMLRDLLGKSPPSWMPQEMIQGFDGSDNEGKEDDDEDPAVHDVVPAGHPALVESATEIGEEDFGTPDLLDLANALVKTMEAHGAYGLAAPQIGASVRMIALEAELTLPGLADEDGDEPVAVPASMLNKEDDEALRAQVVVKQPRMVVVNPQIEVLGDEISVEQEACVSVPDYIAMVERPNAVRLRGFTPEGEAVDLSTEGHHARVVQHECDHLDGILFVDKMVPGSLVSTELMNFDDVHGLDDAHDDDENVG